jgi:hypothetical protein
MFADIVYVYGVMYSTCFHMLVWIFKTKINKNTNNKIGQKIKSWKKKASTLRFARPDRPHLTVHEVGEFYLDFKGGVIWDVTLCGAIGVCLPFLERRGGHTVFILSVEK